MYFIRCVRTVINVILGVLIAGMLTAGAVLFVPKVLGYRPYIVLSGSMEPEIHTGSMAYIDTKDTDIEPGDIMAFYESNGAVVTHRAVRGNAESGYATKGDANDAEDFNIVPQENVIGTYRWSIPYLGYIISALSERTIAVAGVPVPSVAIMAAGIIAGLCILSIALETLDD